MSLADWTNTEVSSKIKQHGILSRLGFIKLKIDDTNFCSWLEEKENNCNDMGLTSTLKLVLDADITHTTHDLFTIESSLVFMFPKCLRPRNHPMN